MMNELTQEQLDELERLEKSMCGGHWHMDDENEDSINSDEGDPEGVGWVADTHRSTICNDAEGIAALRNAAPVLIAAARRDLARRTRQGTHSAECWRWHPECKAEKALQALRGLLVAIENGDACYENSEDLDGYLGNVIPESHPAYEAAEAVLEAMGAADAEQREPEAAG